jgi:hypothetical protein
MPQQVSASNVGQVVRCRRGEFGGADTFVGEGIAEQVSQPFMDRDHLVCGAGQRPQKQQVFLVAREEDPLAISAGDYRTRIHSPPTVHPCGMQDR